MKFDWMSSPQYLAQVGHFFGATTVVVTSGLLSMAASAGWGPVFATIGVGLAVASVKEFVFDVAAWGEGDSWADSLMDWTFYVLGAAAGALLVAVASHVHGGIGQ